MGETSAIVADSSYSLRWSPFQLQIWSATVLSFSFLFLLMKGIYLSALVNSYNTQLRIHKFPWKSNNCYLRRTQSSSFSSLRWRRWPQLSRASQPEYFEQWIYFRLLFLIPVCKGLEKHPLSKNPGILSPCHHSVVSWIYLKILLVAWNIQKSNFSKASDKCSP